MNVAASEIYSCPALVFAVGTWPGIREGATFEAVDGRYVSENISEHNHHMRGLQAIIASARSRLCSDFASGFAVSCVCGREAFGFLTIGRDAFSAVSVCNQILLLVY